jgi:protein-S-isoprenylcysteine O-methyltransferase Ste14
MNEESLRREGRRYIVREQLRPAIYLAILLGCAGTWRWWNAWLMVGALQLATIVYHRVLVRKNPAVLNARGTRHEGSKKRDWIFLGLLGLFGLAAPVVAALDAGQPGWSGPPWAIVLGLALLLPGFVGTTWAMAHNAHFEVTVRIQTDRNHRVCSEGPYRLMRHPGYAFGLLALWSVPLLLGSPLAVWPTLGATATMAARTAFEDATLHAELDGYPAYARDVRHRLIPGVW